MGVTHHSNLGDMGQHYCILEWIKNNYPDLLLVKIDADTIVYGREKFLKVFSEVFDVNHDIILFQSGYTTQDLGGSHEEMHRIICDNYSDAKILMMPQTIFFKSEANKERTSKSYNKASNMLFLARDMVSYASAKEMFPDLKVLAFPDIVTTLIGKYDYSEKPRNGVCLCIRDDGEKFYTDIEIARLEKVISSTDRVYRCDTTIDEPFEKIRNNLSHYILGEADMFSNYKVTITDRYHGTILSLVGGTPVIIIKSNDHKVVTGADWFKGVYDDMVYVADDLDHAYEIYKQIVANHTYKRLIPYFEENYYSKLKLLFTTNCHNRQ